MQLRFGLELKLWDCEAIYEFKVVCSNFDTLLKLRAFTCQVNILIFAREMDGNCVEIVLAFEWLF